MFTIICLDTSEAIKGADGLALLFANGRDAAAKASELTAASGKKHQPRPVKDDAWKEREAERMERGEYTRLPWDGTENVKYWERELKYYEAELARLTPFANDYRDYTGDRIPWCCTVSRMVISCRNNVRSAAGSWFMRALREKPELAEHFAHVSDKVPGNIAFTETAEKGAKDVQTSMKPGRYLSRYFAGYISERDMKIAANEFIALYGARVLKFATTADEIEHVYTHGPQSCMSHPAGAFESSFHPVRVYAAGDLAVAYLSTVDDGEDGGGKEHISGRVLCWPEKKLYSRIYGDEEKLAALLEAQGYSNGALKGARLVKHFDEDEQCYVLPFVDCCRHVNDHGKYLKLDPNGEIHAGSTSGLSYVEEGEICACCADHFSADDMTYVNGDGWYCETCRVEHAHYCDYSEEYYPGDGVEMVDGNTWSHRAFERYGFTCDATGANHHRDEAVHVSNGETWSQDYFDEHGYHCETCDENFPAHDRCDCDESDRDDATDIAA